jgi:hypothetical protein
VDTARHRRTKYEQPTSWNADVHRGHGGRVGGHSAAALRRAQSALAAVFPDERIDMPKSVFLLLVVATTLAPTTGCSSSSAGGGSSGGGSDAGDTSAAKPVFTGDYVSFCAALCDRAVAAKCTTFKTTGGGLEEYSVAECKPWCEERNAPKTTPVVPLDPRVYAKCKVETDAVVDCWLTTLESATCPTSGFTFEAVDLRANATCRPKYTTFDTCHDAVVFEIVGAGG